MIQRDVDARQTVLIAACRMLVAADYCNLKHGLPTGPWCPLSVTHNIGPTAKTCARPGRRRNSMHMMLTRLEGRTPWDTETRTGPRPQGQKALSPLELVGLWCGLHGQNARPLSELGGLTTLPTSDLFTRAAAAASRAQAKSSQRWRGSAVEDRERLGTSGAEGGHPCLCWSLSAAAATTTSKTRSHREERNDQRADDGERD